MTQQLTFATTGPHVLMITNHGVHEWSVVPGMPDTGGQNVYVNQFTEALVDQGYRVTVVNRGGYPHPVTGARRSGVVAHPSGRARILYIEDGTPEFIRKEDMAGHVDALADDLGRKLGADATDVDLIISHYWDGAAVGSRLNERLPEPVPHVWVPHSLGALKKHNMDPETWSSLRIDERIAIERGLLGRIDGAVATSSAIAASFRADYGHEPKYFLPPCIEVERMHPRTAGECEGIWAFLAERSPLSVDELKGRRIVAEISRTDATKRKNVLIEAFARAKERLPDLLLVVSLDPMAGAPFEEAMELVNELGIERDVIGLGSVWDQLPCIYSVTSVYCTPSVMEGFGMSAQEAAATAVPVVSSDLVPFVVEYLLGSDPVEVPIDGGGTLQVGEGGIVVPADNVAGFAQAIVDVLGDESRRLAMGRRALEITIPYFTWERRTADLLADLGVGAERARQ